MDKSHLAISGSLVEDLYGIWGGRAYHIQGPFGRRYFCPFNAGLLEEGLA
jgi:hypothetical protein